MLTGANTSYRLSIIFARRHAMCFGLTVSLTMQYHSVLEPVDGVLCLASHCYLSNLVLYNFRTSKFGG